eukprot:CAMPEP_0113477178 /NCGR_PEP_ID=MMETSP0014_2-20120614/20068_1 /TAXON_ID=2857 /ORGANISM="Nitzschia sp." /LENGTH=427 /DNA_ID=CAMNT_0000370253 /DNA_START=178 /DNA_END=1461 /DNA_ORIENTATION=- /assembly_acc=CAM_ASM_000159
MDELRQPKVITPVESPASDVANNGQKRKSKKGKGLTTATVPKKVHVGVGQPSQVHPRSHLLFHNGDVETTDGIDVMLKKESDFYSPPQKYVVAKTCSKSGNGVTEGWRRRLCEWMYDVVDHFGFDREAVSVAFDFLDRSVAMTHLPDPALTLTKREYQLSAVTSLYLALKVHGEMDPEVGGRMRLKISAFEELSRGFFSASTIEAKELEILSLFRWRVNPPTCAQFVSHFLRLIPKWDISEDAYADVTVTHSDMLGKLYDTAKYLTELSLFVSRFAFKHTASMISVGAILCAIDALHEEAPLPANIKDEFLQSIADISPGFDVSSSRDLHRVQRLIRKLAPSMFETDDPPPAGPIRRTVSVVELVGTNSGRSSPPTANALAVGGKRSTAARALSPTEVSALDVSVGGRSNDRSSMPHDQPPMKRRKL